MGKAPTKHLVIPSKLDQVVPVQKAIIREVEEAGYPQQAVFAIRLALDEALANAVKHGNKLDVNKSVSVDYSVTDQRVTIEIEDEGEGFNPGKLEDPTAEPNLNRPNGRGVMLMNAYMTEVRFNDRGNRVTLVKEKACKLPSV